MEIKRMSDSPLRHMVVETVRGYVALAGRNGRLTHSTLPKPTRGEALEALGAGVRQASVEDEAAFGGLPEILRAYFRGEKADFSSVPLDVDDRGRFHAAVLLAAQRIPPGTLVSYGELARMAGSPGAARAVGNAMARNTMPIVVPCHRVVAAGGKLGGFSSGLEWKRELLELEGVRF